MARAVRAMVPRSSQASGSMLLLATVALVTWMRGGVSPSIDWVTTEISVCSGTSKATQPLASAKNDPWNGSSTPLTVVRAKAAGALLKVAQSRAQVTSSISVPTAHHDRCEILARYTLLPVLSRVRLALPSFFHSRAAVSKLQRSNVCAVPTVLVGSVISASVPAARFSFAPLAVAVTSIATNAESLPSLPSSPALKSPGNACACAESLVSGDANVTSAMPVAIAPLRSRNALAGKLTELPLAAFTSPPRAAATCCRTSTCLTNTSMYTDALPGRDLTANACSGCSMVRSVSSVAAWSENVPSWSVMALPPDGSATTAPASGSSPVVEKTRPATSRNVGTCESSPPSTPMPVSGRPPSRPGSMVVNAGKVPGSIVSSWHPALPPAASQVCPALHPANTADRHAS